MTEEILSRNPNNFSKELWSLKNEKALCDATLVVNGEKIPVHAVVMASSSKYFRSIFVDSALKEITFKDVDKEAMLSLIQYCYTGKIKINEKNASDVFEMAKLFSIITVFESYASTLENNLNASNCLSTWKISRLGGMEKLKKASLDTFTKNFQDVSNTIGFLNLEYSDFHELLTSSNMKNLSPITVYDAIKNWTKHAFDSRKIHLSELLDFIEMTCLPHEDLINESLSLCDSDINCFKKYMNALKSQSNIDANRCIAENTFVAVGSNAYGGSKIIEIFNKTSQEWTEITGITSFKGAYSASIIFNDKLLLIGGFLDGSNISTVESYNLKTGQQKTLSSLRHARRHLAAVQLKGYIYAIGGHTNGPVSLVEKWDGSSESWTDVAPMNSARYYFGAAVLGDEIFVVGGYYNSGLNSVESFDPSRNKWTNRKSMNEKRYGPGIAMVGSYLYVVGGYNGTYSNTAEKYDPSNDIWTLIQPMNTAKFLLAAGNLSGKLVIAGGSSSSGSLSTVEIYDETNGVWKPMAQLKKPRCQFDLVAVPWSLVENLLSNKKSK